MAGADSYEDFVSQILRPTNLLNLKDPVKADKEVTIIVHRGQGQGQTQTLTFANIYPFYTVADLSTIIYKEKELKEEFHPQNQCILIQTAADKFIHFRYIFDKTNDIEIPSPFFGLKANPIFVDMQGNPKKQDITSRDKMLLEDLLFKRKDFTLHLFLYNDILAAYPGLRPINRVDWEGIFRVYFPEYDKTYENGALSQATAAYSTLRVQRLQERQNAIEVLDELLIEGVPLRKPGESVRGESVNFSSVKNLRFTWEKPKVPKGYQPFRLESVFYDMPVTSTIPYIRYYPVSNTPISKIHVEGPLNIPTIEDPQILQKWAQERPLLPEQEFISAKVLLRPGSGSVHPLYANLNIFDDGSAMFSIQPNADTKALSKQADLYNLVPILNSLNIPGLQAKLGVALPPLKIYSPANIKLTDAYIVLSLWLDKDDSQAITTKTLNTVLPYFRPFFQITSSPIKEQNPIAFLRYKGVNNFQTPSRDSQYIMRLLDLQKVQGQTSLPAIVKYYKEEFDVSDEVANGRVAAFLSDREKYSMVNPETMEYTQKENPGIDIAIFGKHPYYTFHIYRVDSKLTLQRIKTLLSLLISVDAGYFKDDSGAEVLAAEEADAQASADADADANASAEANANADAEEAQEMPEFIPDTASGPTTPLEEAKAITVSAALDDSPDDALLFDDELGDFDGFGDEEVPSSHKVASASAQNLASAPPSMQNVALKPIPLTQLANEDEHASADTQEPHQGVQAKSKEKEEDEITDLADIKQLPSRSYFIKRLYFYDKKLFSYSKTHPSLKSYASMCQANALKQPTIMREDEFERMKDIYADDIANGRVLFREYPVKKDSAQEKPKDSKTEIITTLRYGSNLLIGQANIFICSQYWCRYDEVVILKDDFENKTVDRKGRPKDKKTCPFCRQGLVRNRDKVVEGESVIERIGNGKGSDEKKHLYVSFLKKVPHPQGLYLPCCFKKEHYIDEKNPAYDPLTKEAYKLVSAEPVVPFLSASASASASEEEGVTEGELSPSAEGDSTKTFAVDYKKTLSDIFSQSMSDRPYIVGAEKLPLELTRKGPQIGVIPKGADTYFMQDSLGTAVKQGLVVQDHTVWKLMIDNTTNLPNASGFFRLAAENNKRNRPESFLSAVAPYFGENSASAMKRRILEHVQPSLFLSLNYGNFLFNFYNPSTPSPTGGIIREFAQKRLRMDFLIGTPKEAMIRAWKGFTAFEAFMRDTSEQKEYRHFAQLLSLPNMLYWEDSTQIQRANGILFIVLEVKRDSSIEVRCPPYGVSPKQTGPNGCDVAFILHYESGIWEPLFHVRSDPMTQVFETTMVFTRDTAAAWPSSVKQRVEEFEKMCHSSGLGVYTDSPFVKSESLLTLSDAMAVEGDAEGEGTEVYAIMRDIYNHVSFVIYKTNEGLILVPVIDDGTVYPLLRIELEWRSFYGKLAKEEVVREFYAKNLPQYQVVKSLRLDKTDPAREYVHALQLSSGLHVPVKKSDLPAEEIVEGAEIAWSIDRKVAFGSMTPDASLVVDYKEFEEIYQHLRFSFANWFALLGDLKEQINSIIYKDGKPNIDLPLYEKRQRLSIILENELMSWLDSSVNRPKRNPSIKRIDCRVIVEEGGCKDRCVWKGLSGAQGQGQGQGKCLLHIPGQFEVGAQQVNTAQLLIRKLIEELIRFPAKRAELLKQNVSQYVKINEAVRYGSQYIVPENLPAWSEMLRMEWTKKEESRYIEEYVAIQPQEYIAKTVDSLETKDIPELFSYFGEGFQYILDDKPLTTQGLTGYDSQLVTEANALAISRALKFSIYQVIYEAGNPIPPKPLVVRLLLNQKTIAPFLVIIQLPDGRLGRVTMKGDPIPYNKIPTKLRSLFIKIPYSKLD